jgi:hypothetical protein
MIFAKGKRGMTYGILVSLERNESSLNTSSLYPSTLAKAPMGLGDTDLPFYSVQGRNDNCGMLAKTFFLYPWHL